MLQAKGSRKALDGLLWRFARLRAWTVESLSLQECSQRWFMGDQQMNLLLVFLNQIKANKRADAAPEDIGGLCGQGCKKAVRIVALGFYAYDSHVTRPLQGTPSIATTIIAQYGEIWFKESTRGLKAFRVA